MDQKQLIVFPGKMSGVFFKLELPYLVDAFDRVIVVSYEDDSEACERVSREFGVDYICVPDLSFGSCASVLLGLTRNEALKNEIRGKGVREKLYACFYEQWCRSVERMLLGKIRDDLPTVVYSYWLSRGAYAAIKIAEQHPNVCRVVSRAHGFDLYEERNQLGYLPFRLYLSDRLSEIHFISQDGLTYFKSKYPAGRAKLQVSRLGVCRQNARKQITEKTSVCIASCSSVCEVKRIDLIIETLSKINIPFKWLHIGDGELSSSIKALAEKELPSGSFFFLGAVDNEDIPKVYEAYDVDFLINMSDSEGVPVSIMEAFSLGIPAIARDVGGNSEIVDNSTGLLLKDDFVSETRELLMRRFDSDSYGSLSNGAYEKWFEVYRADVNFANFFEWISRT